MLYLVRENKNLTKVNLESNILKSEILVEI